MLRCAGMLFRYWPCYAKIPAGAAWHIAAGRAGSSVYRVSLLKSSVRQIGSAQQMPLGKTVWAACVVTWFNAQAVIDGTMLLGAFKASMTEAQSLHFLFGVLSASCLWFVTLAMVVSLAGSLVTPRVLGVINKICGAVIAVYGLRLLWHFAEII